MGKVLTEGYAAGTVDSGEWLTVAGSAYRDDLVYATPEEAEQRAEELRAKWHDPSRIVVRKVKRVSHPGVTMGSAYRVLPDTAVSLNAFKAPDDARYCRYNEFGGVTKSHTAAFIREVMSSGQAGWSGEYDAQLDEWFVFRLGDRSTGHTLKRAS